MQVFKVYMKIVKRKIASVIMYFVIFLGIAFALAAVGEENGTESFIQTSLSLAVENLDEGILGDALVDYLSVHNDVSEIPETENELLDAMFSRKLDYVLYIPKDFTERLLNGDREEILTDRKVPSSTTGMFADNQIESYLFSVGLYLDGGFELKESIGHADENLKIEAEVVFSDGKEGQEREAAVYYLQYLPYIFICTMVVMLGPILILFNKKEISDRNKCSSMSFFKRNMQLVGASALVAFADYGFMIVMAFLIYPDYMCSGRGVLAMMNALCMILVAMSLAYLAAQIVKNTNSLNIFSNIFGLGFAFLGGVFVPMDIFSDALLVVSKFTPTYWYVAANDAIEEIQHIPEMTPKVAQAFVIEGIYAISLLAVGMLLNRMKARE